MVSNKSKLSFFLSKCQPVLLLSVKTVVIYDKTGLGLNKRPWPWLLPLSLNNTVFKKQLS